MKADLSTWLTKPQAADACGVSTKAIERWAQAGKLEAAFRPQAGTPDVVVYFPEDVAKLAAQRQRTPSTGFLVPGPALAGPNGNGNGTTGRAQVGSKVGAGLILPASIEDLWQVIAAVVQHAVSETSQTSVVHMPAYVPLPEALRVSGLSRSAFRRAVAAGEVTVRGRRYRRTDVEAL